VEFQYLSLPRFFYDCFICKVNPGAGGVSSIYQVLFIRRASFMFSASQVLTFIKLFITAHKERSGRDNNNKSILEVFSVVNIQGIQQSLNQISQICSQLSQNEQTNVSRLSQMTESERSAAQQMQRCMQLVNQVSQQLQQISTTTGTQYTTPGQFTYSTQPPIGGGMGMGIGQQTFSPGGQQYGSTSFEMSREFGRGEADGDGGSATSTPRPSSFTSSTGGGHPTYNTNKDIGK
jgi:hypothetical protein